MILLERNDTGPWVWEAQRLLIRAGFTIIRDGIYGENMELNVKELQQQKQLNAHGKIDDATWNALGWPDNVAGKQLKEEDISAIASQLDVEVPIIKAIVEVESAGRGFLADGRPRILFEGHIFWGQLKKRGQNPLRLVLSNEDILFARWTKAYYKGNELEYERLARAQSIDQQAALASASWGTFQIMGFNYERCGYNSMAAYIESCYASEGEHLKAFAAFITTADLVTSLKTKDWAAFARGYNGAEYKQNRYDRKLAAAYAKYASE